MPFPKGDIDVVPKRKKHAIRFPETSHPENMAPNFHSPLPTLVAFRHVDGLARCSGSLAKCGRFLRRYPEHLSERKWFLSVLSGPQVLLVNQGELSNIIQCLDGFRVYPFKFSGI